MRALLVLGWLATPAVLPAQEPAAGEIVLASAHRAADLLEPGAELAGLETVLAHEMDVRTLCDAARLAIVGLVSDRDHERLQWFRRAESYAREAHQRQLGAADPLYLIGAALGLQAPYMPVLDRMAVAASVRAAADRVLAVEPDHAGALHLDGRLNAAAMRLNPLLRLIARAVLGGEVLDGASWGRGEEAFRRAIEVEPHDPAHRYELALLLRDTGRPEEARAELQAVLEMRRDDALGHHFRDRARHALGTIR
jgi:tetratricopeptide (TPR) repeat protein